MIEIYRAITDARLRHARAVLAGWKASHEPATIQTPAPDPYTTHSPLATAQLEDGDFIEIGGEWLQRNAARAAAEQAAAR